MFKVNAFNVPRKRFANHTILMVDSVMENRRMKFLFILLLYFHTLLIDINGIKTYVSSVDRTNHHPLCFFFFKYLFHVQQCPLTI